MINLCERRLACFSLLTTAGPSWGWEMVMNNQIRPAILVFLATAFSAALQVALLLPQPAQAQITTLLAGRQYQNTLTITNNGDKIQVRVEAGSCYCCDIISLNSVFTGFLNPVDILPFLSPPPVQVTARLAGVDSPTIGADFQRLCFAVPPTIPFALAQLTIFSAGPFPYNAIAYCDETTLYSGFNTSVTDFNFLELTNLLDTESTGTLSRDLTAIVTAVNTVPNPDVTVINSESFTVPEGSRVDVDIHSRSGPGAFGPVKICHNGAPGSLKAVVSQYNITSTVPFDFAPVAQDVAVTRGAIAGVSR